MKKIYSSSITILATFLLLILSVTAMLNRGTAVFRSEGAASQTTGLASDITLNQAVTKFTTAQATGTMQIVNDLFNWLISLFR